MMAISGGAGVQEVEKKRMATSVTGGELKWASGGQKRGKGPGEINEKAHKCFKLNANVTVKNLSLISKKFVLIFTIIT